MKGLLNMRDGSVTMWDMLERKGMEKVYVIEIEKGKEELDLYFDVNGNLLKEVADKDDDSFNYLPSELPTAVAQLLNEKYAGYKLLEVEVDPVSNFWKWMSFCSLPSWRFALMLQHPMRGFPLQGCAVYVSA